MKNSELNINEKELLLHSLKNHNPDLVGKLNQLDSGKLDADIINDIRNAVGIELANKGFNPNWEPNDYGLQLENLIAKLANIYLWPERKEE